MAKAIDPNDIVAKSKQLEEIGKLPARLEELVGKIQKINKKTGKVEDEEYHPQLRDKLNILNKESAKKFVGWAATSTGRGVQNLASNSANRLLGNTVGGFVSSRIDAIGKGKDKEKENPVVTAIINLGTIIKTELKDIATSQAKTVEKLSGVIHTKVDDSKDHFVVGIRDASAKFSKTNSHPTDRALSRLTENIEDAHSRVMSGKDVEPEVANVRKGFVNSYMHDNPNESRVPAKLEKELDKLLKVLTKELEENRQIFKNARLNDENQEKLLQKLVEKDNPENNKSDEVAALTKDSERNNQNKPKEEKKESELSKWMPMVFSAITSLTGWFKSFPSLLWSSLATALPKLVGSIAESVLKLVKGGGTAIAEGASRVLSVAKNAVGSVGRVLASEALPLAAGAAPLAAMKWVTDWVADTSHDKERVGAAKGWGDSLNKMVNYDPDAAQKEWRAKKDKELGIVDTPTVKPQAISPKPLPVTTQSKADKLETIKVKIEQAKSDKKQETVNNNSPTIINNTTNNNTTSKDKVRINTSRNTESSVQRMTDRSVYNSII